MNNCALYISVAIVLVGAVLASNNPLVFEPHKFEIENEDRQLFDFLMNLQAKPHSRLGSYVFKNCGDPKKELLNIKELTFGPDPISFPGDLFVNFDASVASTTSGPLKATVILERKVGSTWIKIPCIGNIGSCIYADLCQLLSTIQDCPPPFTSNKIPCKCPFPQGSYSLPKTKFEVLAAVFPAGDYHAIANVTKNDRLVTCIDLHASFS